MCYEYKQIDIRMRWSNIRPYILYSLDTICYRMISTEKIQSKVL